ncbi:MAG: hypothetical protein IJI14_09960 [Anaerolineaceae bacterium]|nr:hypothetical protein [Anaerolineaceae bacterium]
MKRNYILMVLVSIVLLFFSFAALGKDLDPVSQVKGSWMLDLVYENASGNDKFVLEPNEAGSLYSESKNIYTINDDVSVDLIMADGDDVWNEKAELFYNDGLYSVVSDESIILEFEYDPGSGKLHRYWKDNASDAMYHDLEFVYTKVPAGCWKMTKVFSGKPGENRILLDPEEAGALYSESSNLYEIRNDHTASETLFEGGAEAASISGSWRKSGQTYTVEINGFELELTYDVEKDELHRYWTGDQADAMYNDLDFVYTRVNQ